MKASFFIKNSSNNREVKSQVVGLGQGSQNCSDEAGGYSVYTKTYIITY